MVLEQLAGRFGQELVDRFGQVFDLVQDVAFRADVSVPAGGFSAFAAEGGTPGRVGVGGGPGSAAGPGIFAALPGAGYVGAPEFPVAVAEPGEGGSSLRVVTFSGPVAFAAYLFAVSPFFLFQFATAQILICSFHSCHV